MDYFKEHKLRALKEEIHVIKIKFKELKLLTYPDGDVEKVIIYMQNLAYKIDEKIDEYKNNDADMVKISYLSDVVTVFYRYVCCVLNSDIRNNPREIMVPIKEILNKINSNHLFITEPLTNFNYAVGEILSIDAFLNLLKALDISFDMDTRIIRLLFPVLHQSDVLGGAVMGHELGHYLDLHYPIKLSEKILVKFINKIDCNEYIAFFRKDKEYKLNIDPIDIVKSELPRFVLYNWIKEIVADVIGALLYGISSYFSLMQVLSVSASIDKVQGKCYQGFSESHPRNSMRAFVIINTLKKMNLFNSIDKDLIEKIYEYNDIWNMALNTLFQERQRKIILDENINIIINSKYLSKLEDDLKNNLEWIIELIYDEINNISSDIIYDCKNFEKDIPKAVEKIVNIIPPNEVYSKPLDSISILNAGWIVYMIKFDEMRKNLNSGESNFIDFEVKEIIDNLLKKATLSSNIHRRWLDAASK